MVSDDTKNEFLQERLQHYSEAALAGDAEAQFQLASYYQFGVGLQANMVEATKWYLKAKEQGHHGASRKLFKLNTTSITEIPLFAAVPSSTLTVSKPLSRVHEKMKNFIGMDNVKQQLNTYFNVLEHNKSRKRHGLSTTEVKTNFIFTGNPGTGKTATARIVGQILKEAGVLTSGHVVETNPGQICSTTTSAGSEVVEMTKKLKEARGGVLFIDEAHNFPNHAGKQTDYWRNAITVLLTEITLPKFRPAQKFAVILAGYEQGMNDLLNLEPGLKSRFPETIHFNDYSATELAAIFSLKAETAQYTLKDECNLYLEKNIKEGSNKYADNSGNARYVENLFEKTITCIANRTSQLPFPTKEDITTITVFDIRAAYEKLNRQNKNPQNNKGF